MVGRGQIETLAVAARFVRAAAVATNPAIVRRRQQIETDAAATRLVRAADVAARSAVRRVLAGVNGASVAQISPAGRVRFLAAGDDAHPRLTDDHFARRARTFLVAASLADA